MIEALSVWLLHTGELQQNTWEAASSRLNGFGPVDLPAAVASADKSR
jgi:hypothetical protein